MNKTTINLPWISPYAIPCEFEHFKEKRQKNTTYPVATINKAYTSIGLNSFLIGLIPVRAIWVQILYDKNNLIICLSVNNVEDPSNYKINRSNNSINCSCFLKSRIEPILGKLKATRHFNAYWDDKKKVIFIPLDENKLLKSIEKKKVDEELD